MAHRDRPDIESAPRADNGGYGDSGVAAGKRDGGLRLRRSLSWRSASAARRGWAKDPAGAAGADAALRSQVGISGQSFTGPGVSDDGHPTNQMRASSGRYWPRRSSIQDLGRFSSWSIRARPLPVRHAQNTPSWQFSIRPAASVRSAADSGIDGIGHRYPSRERHLIVSFLHWRVWDGVATPLGGQRVPPAFRGRSPPGPNPRRSPLAPLPGEWPPLLGFGEAESNGWAGRRR